MNDIMSVPFLWADITNPLLHQTPLHGTEVQAVKVPEVVPTVRATKHVQFVADPRQRLAVTRFGGISCGFHDNPLALEQVKVLDFAA